MTLDDRQPWKRRDDETDAQWMAFRFFRDLGPSRTTEKAWKKYSEARDLKLDRIGRHFWEWKRENDWDERVRAFDRHNDEIRLAENRQMREAATKVLMRQIENVAKRLVVTALGDQALERSDFEELPDGLQFEAMTEVLDRGGVDAPDRIEVDGDLYDEADNAPNLDLSLFTEFLTMDSDERRERLKSLEDINETAEATHPDDFRDDGAAPDDDAADGDSDDAGGGD